MLLDETLALSPSDLSNYLACPHLTNLTLAVVREELERPHADDTHVDLIRRKGDEHEAAYLARLEADGRTIARMPGYEDDFEPDTARHRTEQAIRERTAEVIYQPYLVSADGRWRGFAGFLDLTPAGTYEPVDTKLAPRPSRRTCSSSSSTPNRSSGCRGRRSSTSTSRTGAASGRASASPSSRRTTGGCARAFSMRSRARTRRTPGRAGTAGSATFGTSVAPRQLERRFAAATVGRYRFRARPAVRRKRSVAARPNVP